MTIRAKKAPANRLQAVKKGKDWGKAAAKFKLADYIPLRRRIYICQWRQCLGGPAGPLAAAAQLSGECCQ